MTHEQRRADHGRGHHEDGAARNEEEQLRHHPEAELAGPAAPSDGAPSISGNPSVLEGARRQFAGDQVPGEHGAEKRHDDRPGDRDETDGEREQGVRRPAQHERYAATG